MNPKFFSLPQEKQSRIVNAAIRVFGGADYRHAVTDDIAAYAGISKGLLFHYFGNKRGLYQYAFDYCLRFIAQAANRAIPEGKMDFFAITLQCEHAKVGIMKRYPHVYAFIMRAYYEEDEDVADVVQPLRLSWTTRSVDALLPRIDETKFREAVDPAQALRTLVYCAEGFMLMRRREGALSDPDRLVEGFDETLRLLKRSFYKEEYHDLS